MAPHSGRPGQGRVATRPGTPAQPGRLASRGNTVRRRGRSGPRAGPASPRPPVRGKLSLPCRHAGRGDEAGHAGVRCPDKRRPGGLRGAADAAAGERAGGGRAFRGGGGGRARGGARAGRRGDRGARTALDRPRLRGRSDPRRRARAERCRRPAGAAAAGGAGAGDRERDGVPAARPAGGRSADPRGRRRAGDEVDARRERRLPRARRVGDAVLDGGDARGAGAGGGRAARQARRRPPDAVPGGRRPRPRRERDLQCGVRAARALEGVPLRRRGRRWGPSRTAPKPSTRST